MNTLSPRASATQPSLLAADRAAVTLMPLPFRFSLADGYLIIDETFRVALSGYVEDRLEGAARRLVQRLSAQTGIPLPLRITRGPAQATLTLHCDSAAPEMQSAVEDESYELVVWGEGARISAPKPYGVLRGIETFLQLVRVGPEGFLVPAVRVEDRPRFPWRGLMMDVCRHWMPTEVIKRNLDAMAAVKLNVLHLHLSEDQGFRIESRRFPRLHVLGSDGDYFTQEQVQEIVRYAYERGIRVVPEFDIPGHTTSWLVGYPELASAPGPYEIERTFGIKYAAMDPTREEVYRFLDQFFEEMAALFPDPYIHIGGDEVNGVQWNQNPRIQAFMREHNLQDNHALQAYFNRRVQAILQQKGKKMVGWDEILHPDLPHDIVVHSWRGHAALALAAAQGYQGILSLGYYLDYSQPAAFHYSFDPLPAAPAVAIDATSQWQSWRLEVSAPMGNVRGHLTIAESGPSHRGLISLDDMNLWAELRDLRLSASALSFRFHSGFGVVTGALQLQGENLIGALQFAGMPMQLQGIRSAGSDIPGTEPPVIPGAIHLTREQESQILGGEACMWAEIANPETVDGRIWPRMAAIAERLWSPVESTQDEADMYLRLAATSDWLVWTGIRHRANYLPMLQRMTTGDIEPLCTLAEIVEPIKFYARHGTRTYSQFTPLNRLVDAVPAESDKARAFAIMVDALLADSQRETHRTVIQTWLTSWRDNHARLAPLLGASFLLQPLEPLSEDLTQVAELGLESLQAFVDGRAPTEEQRQRGLALLERAAQPCDELLLAIVPAVRRLVGG